MWSLDAAPWAQGGCHLYRVWLNHVHPDCHEAELLSWLQESSCNVVGVRKHWKRPGEATAFFWTLEDAEEAASHSGWILLRGCPLVLDLYPWEREVAEAMWNNPVVLQEQERSAGGSPCTPGLKPSRHHGALDKVRGNNERPEVAALEAAAKPIGSPTGGSSELQEQLRQRDLIIAALRQGHADLEAERQSLFLDLQQLKTQRAAEADAMKLLKEELALAKAEVAAQLDSRTEAPTTPSTFAGPSPSRSLQSPSVSDDETLPEASLVSGLAPVRLVHVFGDVETACKEDGAFAAHEANREAEAKSDYVQRVQGMLQSQRMYSMEVLKVCLTSWNTLAVSMKGRCKLDERLAKEVRARTLVAAGKAFCATRDDTHVLCLAFCHWHRNLLVSRACQAQEVLSRSEKAEAALASALTCSLSLHVFRRPMLAPDGQVYEKSWILQWLESNGTSPFTKKPMRTSDLLRDRALEQAVEALWVLRGEKAPEDEQVLGNATEEHKALQQRLEESEALAKQLMINLDEEKVLHEACARERELLARRNAGLLQVIRGKELQMEALRDLEEWDQIPEHKRPQAWRKLMLKYHPDKHQDLREVAEQITQQLQVLKPT